MSRVIGVVLAILLTACVSEPQPPTITHPLPPPGDSIELRPVLTEWHPEGFFVNTEEYGIGCGWYGEIGTWLHVYDLDKPAPWIPYNAGKMTCGPLEEYPSGWLLRCSQEVEAPFFGLYWNLLDFQVFREADALGNKGWLNWTKHFTQLGVWCAYSIRITDERPRYEWN